MTSHREKRRKRQMKARKEADRMIKRHGRNAKKLAREKSEHYFARGNDNLGDFWHLVGEQVRVLARGRRNPSVVKGDVVEVTADSRRYSKGMKGRVVEIYPVGHHFENERGLAIETMGGYGGRTRVLTVPESHIKLRRRPRSNPGTPRERGGIWLDPPGARDHTSIDHDAIDRERRMRAYRESGDNRKVYEVEAVNHIEGKKCELEVLAKSPENAISLAARELAKLGSDWEIVEVEQKTGKR